MSETKRVKKDMHGETRWCVVGPLGGVDFHCSSDDVLKQIERVVPGMGRSGGIEEHRRQPADYQKDKPADFDNCWLLDGPCWCDGSSLYASEVLIPIYERCAARDDYEPLWRQLESEYRNRFERVEETT